MAGVLRRFLAWADDFGVPPRGPHISELVEGSETCICTFQSFHAVTLVNTSLSCCCPANLVNPDMRVSNQTTRPAPLTPAWLRLTTLTFTALGRNHIVSAP